MRMTAPQPVHPDRSLLMTTSIHPVVLCGGNGTRLWPLSRKALPKQFTPLIDGKSLLQMTLERLRSLPPSYAVNVDPESVL